MAVKGQRLDEDFKEFSRAQYKSETVSKKELELYLNQNQEDALSSGTDSEEVKKFLDYLPLHVFLPWLQKVTGVANVAALLASRFLVYGSMSEENAAKMDVFYAAVERDPTERVLLFIGDQNALYLANPAGMRAVAAGEDPGENVILLADGELLLEAATKAENAIVMAGGVSETANAAEEKAGNAAKLAEQAMETAEKAEVIAKGKASGYVFDTAEDAQVWFESNKETLSVGDHLYIRATDTSDFWFDGTELLPLEADKVDMAEYVKNTDYGTQTKAGIVKGSPQHGIFIYDGGLLMINPTTKAAIDAKRSAYQPITVEMLDYAIKVGLTTNKETLTEEEKEKISDWTGAATKKYVDDAIYGALEGDY